MVWTSLEDGVVITSKMSDLEVYVIADEFGRQRMIEAMEIFLDMVEEIA
jgi:hypothetical protein